MNKKILGTIIILFAGIMWFLAKSGLFINPAPPNLSDKIAVVVSFYPLADFAKNVGGDLVSVTNITPAGAEPHDYEPSPKDIAKLYDAKLVILNGGGLDPWADKIESDLRQKGVMVVRMSDFLGMQKQHDPHFWLDPENAAKEADIIAEALIKIDNVHGKDYSLKVDDFKRKLGNLDREYENGLANCPGREIVVSHDAFTYLANRYHLTTYSIFGLLADAEPSPKTIADIVDVVKEKRLKYIFFETLVSPKLSETVAHETGAQILPLNPIEGLTEEQIASGENYISIMKSNLLNLRRALSCR